MQYPPYFFFFFFNDTATTEIYTLSLHDALPICCIVPLARAQPLSKQIVSSLQVDELDVRIDLKQIAIAAFQCGTSQDDVLAERTPSQHGLANGIEPRDAVAIVERDAARHFLDVGGRMKPFARNQTPTELGTKQFADGGFAGPGGAHQKDDHGNIIANYGWPKTRPHELQNLRVS